jgi:hypothetical protein
MAIAPGQLPKTYATALAARSWATEPIVQPPIVPIQRAGAVLKMAVSAVTCLKNNVWRLARSGVALGHHAMMHRRAMQVHATAMSTTVVP